MFVHEIDIAANVRGRCFDHIAVVTPQWPFVELLVRD